MAQTQPNSDDLILAEVLDILLTEGDEVAIARLIAADLQEEAPSLTPSQRHEVAALAAADMVDDR